MSRTDETTVVTERGQVSIPAPIRRDMDLQAGKHLRWERVGPGQLRVIVVEAQPAPGATRMLGFAKRFRKTRRTATWMNDLREGEEG